MLAGAARKGAQWTASCRENGILMHPANGEAIEAAQENSLAAVSASWCVWERTGNWMVMMLHQCASHRRRRRRRRRQRQYGHMDVERHRGAAATGVATVSCCCPQSAATAGAATCSSMRCLPRIRLALAGATRMGILWARLEEEGPKLLAKCSLPVLLPHGRGSQHVAIGRRKVAAYTPPWLQGRFAASVLANWFCWIALVLLLMLLMLLHVLPLRFAVLHATFCSKLVLQMLTGDKKMKIGVIFNDLWPCRICNFEGAAPSKIPDVWIDILGDDLGGSLQSGVLVHLLIQNFIQVSVL
ncbi:hypothetical protein ACLKA6_005705 [Drosophila palustris]